MFITKVAQIILIKVIIYHCFRNNHWLEVMPCSWFTHLVCYKESSLDVVKDVMSVSLFRYNWSHTLLHVKYNKWNSIAKGMRTYRDKQTMFADQKHKLTTSTEKSKHKNICKSRESNPGLLFYMSSYVGYGQPNSRTGGRTENGKSICRSPSK